MVASSSGVVDCPTEHVAPAMIPPVESLGRVLAPYKAIREIMRFAPLWAEGTDGLRLELPEGTSELLQLRDELPPSLRLIRLRERLVNVLAKKPSAEETAEALAAIMAMRQGGKDDQGAPLAALTFALTMEAELEGWAPCVVAAGIYTAVRSSAFMPQLSEILDHTSQADRLFREAPVWLRHTGDALYQIEDLLIARGIQLDGTEEECPI